MSDAEHEKQLVDLVNPLGKPVGQKRRDEIDKTKDIYHSIHILLVTPTGQLVLSTIPERKNLPNLYTHRVGSTIATIRRSGESPAKAAVRALSRELFIDSAEIYELGERFHTFRDGHQTYMTAYYLVAEAPGVYSHTNVGPLTTTSANDFRKLLATRREEVAPTFEGFWRMYEGMLPV